MAGNDAGESGPSQAAVSSIPTGMLYICGAYNPAKAHMGYVITVLYIVPQLGTLRGIFTSNETGGFTLTLSFNVSDKTTYFATCMQLLHHACMLMADA